MRVGRAPLDEDAIRQIEEHNPDVEFDWTRILKGESPTQESRPRTEALPQERRPRPQRQRAPAPPAAVRTEAEPAVPAPAISEAVPADQAPAAEVQNVAPVPAFDEDGTPTDAMAEERSGAIEQPERPAATAALARLGPEGLLRLRARHSEVLARISEKVTDPVRRDELKSLAERLNPDTWVTDSEVGAGLEQYEAVFESLRSVVGRRRKRRRRRAATGGGTPEANQQADSEAPGGEDGPEDEL